MSTLYDISWQVDEPTYRADSSLSYSTLAKYERGGFESLASLSEHISTPALTNGSAVDAIITGGKQEFDNNFIVASIPNTPDTIKQIVNALFREFSETHSIIGNIPDVEVIGFASAFNYSPHWKPETRAKVIKEKGADYYNYLYLADGKTIITQEEYELVLAQVQALKESEATKWYFQTDNPFDEVIRHYQLKFKDSHDGVDYRSMADLIIEIPAEKLIIPCDLKTSSHTEYQFFESFNQWRYDIQARLYWRNIRANMDKSEKYKEWTLANYRFIVVNKKTLNPLVWEFKDTQEIGTLSYGKTKQIELRDPYDIGKELSYYLQKQPKVPVGISETDVNEITDWLNTL